ncbi:MAG: hypothetical protein US36_C0008G0036 [Candidatus Wolfebacteria bacterium GW2011_GWC1_37_10]|uniref:Uncharacterized protein n=1 Tax=Candidatus Wolfebacteria bacterium GW2011_GWC1_37_10 TaxID=1619010 RepID=A0A0G0IDP0_9BACT|nr:MAG: hypothetical protein US36_C0008G0036 [Candidatus Wolfebacteria bacterium GW2011_GWC1_37_10]
MINNISCPHCKCSFPIRITDEELNNRYKKLSCFSCHKQISISLERKFMIISAQPIIFSNQNLFDITCPKSECGEINPIRLNKAELENKFKKILCRFCRSSLAIITKKFFNHAPFVQVFLQTKPIKITLKDRQAKT